VTVIVGTVRVPRENIDKARPHMEAMVTASRAEAGCTSYSYAQDMLVHVIEV
jgi:quinol monooxygenase YgiN